MKTDSPYDRGDIHINKNDKEVGGISCALYAKDDSEYFKKAVKNLK